MLNPQPVLAIAASADFYPGMGDGDCDTYAGNTIEWTFSLPRDATVGAGVYEIRFVRTMEQEEALGFPILGGERVRPDNPEAA